MKTLEPWVFICPCIFAKWLARALGTLLKVSTSGMICLWWTFRNNFFQRVKKCAYLAKVTASRWSRPHRCVLLKNNHTATRICHWTHSSISKQFCPFPQLALWARITFQEQHNPAGPSCVRAMITPIIHKKYVSSPVYPIRKHIFWKCLHKKLTSIALIALFSPISPSLPEPYTGIVHN